MVKHCLVEFGFSATRKIIITGFSYGGWLGLCVLLREELREFLGGVILLAPALGCFLPFYQENLLALQSLGRTEQVAQLNRGEVVCLDAAFRPVEGFPLSRPFMESSWAFHLDKLDLSRLSTPITLIIGDQDRMVKSEDVDNLYKKLPLYGKKSIQKLDGLEHDFESRQVFASVVRPEIERMALEITQEAIPKEEELDSSYWVMYRKAHKKRVFLHLTTGRETENKNVALGHEKEMKAERWRLRPRQWKSTLKLIPLTTSRLSAHLLNSRNPWTSEDRSSKGNFQQRRPTQQLLLLQPPRVLRRRQDYRLLKLY